MLFRSVHPLLELYGYTAAERLEPLPQNKIKDQNNKQRNSSQNKILANKNSGKEELLRIMAEDTRQREALAKSLVGFHELARENCSEVEWTQIMKSFTREMQMSSR